MTDRSFRGLFPILAMPFDSKGNIDEEDLRREVEFCIFTGADGLGLAMASEITKLSEDERNLVTKTVVRQTNGRAKIVINSGAPSTKLAIRMSKNAAELGADSVMIIPPVGVSEYEVRAYYEDIARAITDRRRQIKKMKIFVFTSTVLFIAVMAWGYLKYDKANAAVTEKERELETLKIDKVVLRTRLEREIKITDKQQRLVDTLLKAVKSFDLEKVTKQIDDKYGKERDIVTAQPIDSTISELSDWLNEVPKKDTISGR